MPPPLNTLFSNVLIVLGIVIKNGLTISSLLFKGLKLFLRRQMFSSLTLANVFQSDWSRWPCVTSNISVKKKWEECVYTETLPISIYMILCILFLHVCTCYMYESICSHMYMLMCVYMPVHKCVQTSRDTTLVFSFFSLYLLCKVFLWIWSSLKAPTLTS